MSDSIFLCRSLRLTYLDVLRKKCKLSLFVSGGQYSPHGQWKVACGSTVARHGCFCLGSDMPDGQVFALDLTGEAELSALKDIISVEFNIPPERQRILLDGEPLRYALL